MMRGSRIYTNVHQGPDSLHRPWAGSDTYDKNLNRSKDGGRSDFQRERDSTLDTLHHEEDRARSIRNYEVSRAEKMQEVRNNKAIIEANARAEAAERKVREAARSAEVAARAAELEADRRAAAARAAETAARYDAALAALKNCQAFNDNGTPCKRKANPGLDFCYLHVGYTGKLQDKPEKTVLMVETSSERSAETPASSAPSPAAASSVVSVPETACAPECIVNEPQSVHRVAATDHLLVILTVSLISLFGIGVLGALALGFYAIRQRKEFT